MSWSPINWPMLMLLRAWIGAKRARDREPAAAEHFALRCLFAARADALLRAGDDHFEVTADERAGREQPLAVDDQTCIRVLRDLVGVEVEAHPRRRHRIGVDVVEQVVRRHIAHPQRQRARELLTDLFGILGEIEDALPRGERETAFRHRGGPYHPRLSLKAQSGCPFAGPG
jgi:hypothetical protein